MHSFRHGGAEHAWRVGVDGDYIRIMGGWHSEAIFHYLQSRARGWSEAAKFSQPHRCLMAGVRAI